MGANDLPAIFVGICGVLFLLIAACYPWLSHRFGLEEARPERRMLSAVLGIAMLCLWAIWRYVRLD